MSTGDTLLASAAGVRLSAGQLLGKLRREGRLRPLVLEALAEEVIQEHARQAGLAVSAAELQAAADAFRRRHGLSSAADTHAWLKGQGLSVDEFKASLEGPLLAAKLRQHLTALQVDEYFSTHRADFDELQLARVLVERDDLARELASQVRDEGRALEEVAGEQGLPVVHRRLLRRDLGGPLAEALASTQPGELVGPVGTPEGFTLVVIEERRPAELDPATRQGIQEKLFEGWMAAKVGKATLDKSILGATG